MEKSYNDFLIKLDTYYHNMGREIRKCQAVMNLLFSYDENIYRDIVANGLDCYYDAKGMPNTLKYIKDALCSSVNKNIKEM